MKIENIEFHGFKAKRRYARVEFSEENVTVIYGENGCGKTTFLKAINSFLSQDSDELSSIGINKILCNVNHNEEVICICVELKDEGYDWSEFESSCLNDSKSLSLGVERGISTQSFKIEPEFLMNFFSHPKFRRELFSDYSTPSKRSMYELSEELSYFLKRRNSARFRHKRSELNFEDHHLYFQSIKIENIEELLLQRYRDARFAATRRIQSALFDTLSVAIDVETSRESTQSIVSASQTNKESLGDRIKENRTRLIEALDDGDDNRFKNRIVDILRKLDNANEMEKILEHSLLSKLFQNMIDELEVEKLILSSINLLVEKFNTYLINDKKLVINGTEVFIDIGNERHTVNELSSGERHILTFLALVLFEGADRNFLIIDEPEISLNIKWQRELMSLFSTLLPSTQIIVASHSPAIANKRPDYLCELKVWRD